MNGLVAVRLEEIGGSTVRGVVGYNVTVGLYEAPHCKMLFWGSLIASMKIGGSHKCEK